MALEYQGLNQRKGISRLQILTCLPCHVSGTGEIRCDLEYENYIVVQLVHSKAANNWTVVQVEEKKPPSPIPIVEQIFCAPRVGFPIHV
ncbi:hypothetical protein DPMN_180791 [Dreissena polymorpha]|uniref:Uncharacterized protein n=1 Tax=Dreissena polymorpha TaxID=45954 RepID=A0A9D4DBJ7_DREPO|nr:hypothetical protein DPMN_180791 [Dreissena polymorpha]